MNCVWRAWARGRGGDDNTIGVLGSVGTDSPWDNRYFPVATACPFTISCWASVARRWICTSSAQCCFLQNKTRLFPIPKTTQGSSSLYTASFSHKQSLSHSLHVCASLSLSRAVTYTNRRVATRPGIVEIGWGCRAVTRPPLLFTRVAARWDIIGWNVISITQFTQYQVTTGRITPRRDARSQGQCKAGEQEAGSLKDWGEMGFVVASRQITAGHY